MGRAIEIITAQATAPGATFTAMAAVTGNSLTVRETRKSVQMVSLFQSRQAAGGTRITSPLMHDNTIAVQLLGSTAAKPFVIMAAPQQLFAQDTLSVQATGSATAGDIELSSYLNIYEDLPGVDGNFIDVATLKRRGVNIFANTISIATGTAGGYSGSVAVNSAQDVFKANTDYALLGYTVSVNAAHAVRYSGPDWGNLGVGGPAFAQNAGDRTDDWFVKLALMYGRCIPVMNSANKGITTIDAAQDENGGDPTVTSIWVQLS